MSKNYQKTLKKYHKWVDRKNNKIKKYIPPHKQKNRRKLRHHINGGFKHQRNVPKQKNGHINYNKSAYIHCYK